MTWNIIKERPKQKTSELLEECKSLFPVWTWQDFKEFDKDFPSPKKATTRTFEPNIEADEKHKSKSYDDLKKEGIEGITLREYLIMFRQYFRETGQRLDKDNWTLCSGSLYRDGHVPLGFSYGDELVVDWYYRGDAHSSSLRTRGVVSKPSSLNLVDLNKIKIEIGGKKYKLTHI